MRRRGGYRAGFGERWAKFTETQRGILDEPDRPVWVHAVSVGEFHVADAFMKKLREQRPDVRFVLTVNTSTARKMALATVKEPDLVLYPPVDSPLVQRRALRQIRPKAMVLVENEVWPNQCRILHKAGVPITLLNGRLSDRSYSRLRKLRRVTGRIYPLIDLFCMQSKEDAERIRDLGAPAGRVQVLPSAKYEIAERDPEAEGERKELLRACGFLTEGPVLMGSSTWPGEEDVLLRIYTQQKEAHPGLRLILVPRHAERMKEVEESLQRANVRYVRRSQLNMDDRTTDPDVFVLDTTGELRHFYAFANLVFVGKSLFRPEGQSPIEAARAGCSVIVGPGMANFKRVMQDLREASAVCEVRNEAELMKAVSEGLTFFEQSVEQGRRAAELTRANAGALSRSVELFLNLEKRG